MKRVIVAVLLTMLFLSSTSASYALINNPKVPGDKTSFQEIKKEEIRQRIEEKRLEIEKKKEEIKERIQIKKATQAAKLQNKNKERVRSYFGRIDSRFTATIERLEILISRIESRLAVYEQGSPDLDLTEIYTQIETAKALLLDAEADISAASANLEVVLDSEDPKDAFAVIKETVLDAKDKLKEVHSILVHVIGDIKGLRVGNTVDTATQEADTQN
jgi:hypothetical protein